MVRSVVKINAFKGKKKAERGDTSKGPQEERHKKDTNRRKVVARASEATRYSLTHTPQ